MEIQGREKQLIQILSYLTRKYTSAESTSVSYDKANQLMGAIQYCLMHAAEEKTSLFDTYQNGYQNVLSYVSETMKRYEEIAKNFEHYGNRNLKETFLAGIPAFFQRYDVRFFPQATIITMDYPTFVDRAKMMGEQSVEISGIDLIASYIEEIGYEQQFLGIFPQSYVLDVLEQYADDYKSQYFNICEPVIADILLHAMLGIPVYDKIDITQEAYQSFRQINSHALWEKLYDCFGQIMDRYFLDEIKPRSYLKRCLPDLAARIKL